MSDRPAGDRPQRSRAGEHRVERSRETRIDSGRGVFMISVAAELAGMHPQTLRLYEARGLISPKRSRGNTRLYSQSDVELLRRIQDMTTEMGMNLAGVDAVLEMEHEMERMRGELERFQRRASELQRRMLGEVERAQRSFTTEIVPYEEVSRPLIRIPIRLGPARDESSPADHRATED